jgi:Kef-type K+ transport system membrane component KefB
MDGYLLLLALVAGLFFLPKALQRFRVPAPLTELGLGVALGPVGAGWLQPDQLLQGLSGFGISALFLFAGLEVDVAELNARRRTLLTHLLIQVLLVAGATAVGVRLGLDTGVAVLVAAAVMSPSVGYIVAALESRPVAPELVAWIKQKAVAGELMAIGLVLLFANSTSLRELAQGLGGIAVLFLAVPVLILLFHKIILPWAPKTEFTFLLVIALAAAEFSHHIGVHYLVGAFLVGVVARHYLVWLSRRELETGGVREALTAFRFFASFFIPFFFFLVGLRLPPDAFSREAAVLAGALFVAAVPLRIVSTLAHRRIGLKEGWREAASVGVFLMPTTVFTLAVAEILRQRFDIADWIYGGLVVYGAATSLVPLLSPAARPEGGDEILAVAAEEVFPKHAPGSGPGSAG